MSEQDDDAAARSAQRVGDQFTKVLDRHGYAFQYAVMRQIEELHDAGHSPWRLVASEYPVVAGAGQEARRGTHIDAVQVFGSSKRKAYLVTECKRVNPALGSWCFARSPYVFYNPEPQELVFDQLRFAPGYTIARVPIVTTSLLRGDRIPICHIAREIRTDAEGDTHGSEGRAFDEAIGQVLRGCSGLMNVTYLAPDESALFIPVIFTTAELWVTGADLSQASLLKGVLPEKVTVEKRDWIFFNHNRSLALSPDSQMPRPTSDDLYDRDRLAALLRWEFARSIAVVSASGVESFLKSGLPEKVMSEGELPRDFPKE